MGDEDICAEEGGILDGDVVSQTDSIDYVLRHEFTEL
jgi:hypothetical protein